MKFKKDVKGAVSLFLVIILVPCIVVTSIFVDLGRVHMSKGMATSSADLALNSLLTNYDADLNEWYGLVASCQNIDEFYDISAQFFLRTISSQGLSDEEIILLSDYYANATSDDSIYDFLRVECQSAPSEMISAVGGADLSNAALLKDQVVEFMKYRAPIEIVSGLINRINSDPTMKDAIEAEKNTELVEDKQEFFKAEGELAEAAFYSYKAIYNYYDSTKNFTNDELSSYYDKLSDYKLAYYAILAEVIVYLSNTSGLATYERYTASLYTASASSVSSRKVLVDMDSNRYEYYINESKVNSLIKTLRNSINDFIEAKDEFGKAAEPLLSELPYGDKDTDPNAVQWWVQMNKAVNSSDGHTKKFEEAADSMLKAYSRVMAIDKCILDGVPSNWEYVYGADELIEQVKNLQDDYLKSGKTDKNDPYLRAVNALEEVSAAQIKNIDENNRYVTVDGQRKRLAEALSYISSQLTSMKSEVQGYIDLLNIAIDGDRKKTPSLDELKEKARNYDTTLDEWSNTANNTKKDDGGLTKLASEDKKEIATRKQLDIDEDAVADLKNRLVNIRSQLKDFVEAVDSLKLGGTALTKIKDVSTFKSKAKVDESRIELKNSGLKKYTEELFEKRYAPQTDPTMKHANDTNYNLTIDPETGKVNTPELFKYLHETYEGLEIGEVEKAKSEKEGAQKTQDETEKNAKEADRYSGGGAEVPHEFSAEEKFDAIDSVTGIIGVVKDLISLNFANMRDDLYATTYIMEMFSYATFENQGLYQLLGEANKDKLTELTLDNYSDDNYYGSVMGKGPDDKEKTWLSNDPQVTQNKTLTNKLINKTNNQAYGAEVEYILFGGKGRTNVQNVKSAYTNIYVIRYGLNVVSGFQNFWDPTGLAKSKVLTAKAIYGAALAVQSATMGVVPIPVTEAVLIPILTVFETSCDLDRLQAGFPVELYKSEPDMWWVSFESTTESESNKGIGGFMKKLADGNLLKGKNNSGNGIFYSDYLTLFVYLGLNSSAQEGMYQRMAEVIQFNIGEQIKSDNTEKTEEKSENTKKYSLKNSIVYFELKATLRVQPLMITLPIFNGYENGMSTSTDWCTYTITVKRGYS